MFPTMDTLGYIDPTSGSIVLQALIAGALGIGWRVSSLFRRRRKAEEVAVEKTQNSEADEATDITKQSA